MNLLFDIFPRILAEATTQIAEETPILNAVDRRYESDAKQKGDAVWVPVDASDETVFDVVPGHVATTDSDIRVDALPVSLSNWKEVVFTLDHKELRSLENGVIPGVVSRKVRALRNEIAASVWREYRKSHNFVGTPGTTPFIKDADHLRYAKESKRILNDYKANSISRNRYMLLDTDAEAEATMLPEFLEAQKAGTDLTITEGVIGRKLGFDWMFDNTDMVHPNNSLSTKLGHTVFSAPITVAIENELQPRMNPQVRNIVTVAAAAGATGGVIKGDIFTIAGDLSGKTYVVEAPVNIANGKMQIQFYPAPQGAFAPGSALTFKAAHSVNLAMHDRAIALVMAPFLKPTDLIEGMGENSLIYIDPVYGIPLRIEYYREYKQERWSIDALWGTQTIYRDHLVRIAG